MSASREKHLRQGTKPVENNAVSAKPALSGTISDTGPGKSSSVSAVVSTVTGSR